MPSFPDINPRELVAGLSGPSLLSFANSCAEEILLRGLPVPENFGALAVAGTTGTSSSSERGPEQTTDLINPLERPGDIEPSEFADGRVVVIHRARILEVDGEIREVMPQPYSVLAVLAANAGKLVSQEFLLQCAWQDQEPGANAVNSAVNRARTVLGVDDLSDAKNGAIQYQRGKGWVALTSISRNQD
jgi:hypothetical protein